MHSRYETVSTCPSGKTPTMDRGPPTWRERICSSFPVIILFTLLFVVVILGLTLALSLGKTHDIFIKIRCTVRCASKTSVALDFASILATFPARKTNIVSVILTRVDQTLVTQKEHKNACSHPKETMPVSVKRDTEVLFVDKRFTHASMKILVLAKQLVSDTRWTKTVFLVLAPGVGWEIVANIERERVILVAREPIVVMVADAEHATISILVIARSDIMVFIVSRVSTWMIV